MILVGLNQGDGERIGRGNQATEHEGGQQVDI